MTRFFPLFLYLCWSCCFCYPLFAAIPASPDDPFVQEYHIPLPVIGPDGANDVRSLLVDDKGDLWSATRAGIYKYEMATHNWVVKSLQPVGGPAYCLALGAGGTVWAGAWDGLYQFTATGSTKTTNIAEPISAVLITDRGVLAFGPAGAWKVEKDVATKIDLPFARSIRSVKSDHNGGYLIATERGLFHQKLKAVKLYQDEAELLGASAVDVEWAADGKLWIAGMGGITLYENDRRVGQLTPAEGLASIYIQCLQKASDGVMWIGTRNGVIRYDGRSWSLRHSRRWLLGDDVRDIAFDRNGTAWIATNAGISALATKRMTLAQKADHYYRVLQARHVRPPYLVEKCRLRTRGDTLSWQPRDDDNDGQYTGMYLAMESFRYAVTKNPQAQANARKAFSALHFLQTVTGTEGFVARTVIPADWTNMADPNRTYTDQEWADLYVADPREKRVENMWRRSQDAKWLWKGDTSSDEITGHMYGYLNYYDLAADSEEKQRVKQLVCRVVDYIVDNGFVLNDIDGRHTQWGVWAPQRLNHDPDWSTERGINSVELLSYVKLAFHVSGDQRYQQLYLDLLQKYNLAKNIPAAKTYNPAWITHIDDELLALAYPCLLLHETDDKLLAVYRQSLGQWYQGAVKDKSPFFNFTNAALSGQDPRLTESLFFLRDTPLDLIRWRVDNSHRLDIRFGYFTEFENLQMDRVLPPSEISFFRWDNNPWYPTEGDDGETESDGVFWLLPYWMGRYYGFIR